jgi:hypothetical protein
MRGDCVEKKCRFWTHLYGKDPQSDQTIDKFGCAIEFLPVLLVENAQMIRHAAASTDKVANQVFAGNKILESARADAQRRIENINTNHQTSSDMPENGVAVLYGIDRAGT